MMERLLAEHRQMEGLAGELRAALIVAAPVSAVVEDLRWALTRLMMKHIAYEDKMLFLPLERDPRPEVAAIARAMKAQLLATHLRYEAHVTRWTMAAAARDWPGYRRDTLAQIAVLIERIRREERDLFPLAAGNQEIRAGVRGMDTRNWARTALDLQRAIRTR